MTSAAAPTVRTATAADAPVLARLRWRWRAEERAEPGLDRATFLALFETWVVDHLATHVPFVVELDGSVVGMAWLMLAPRVPTPGNPDRRVGDLQSVFVVPEARDAGVGTVLLDAVLAMARAHGLTFVTVHSSDRAVPFYQRNGFSGENTWLQWNPA